MVKTQTTPKSEDEVLDTFLCEWTEAGFSINGSEKLWLRRNPDVGRTSICDIKELLELQQEVSYIFIEDFVSAMNPSQLSLSSWRAIKETACHEMQETLLMYVSVMPEEYMSYLVHGNKYSRILAAEFSYLPLRYLSQLLNDESVEVREAAERNLTFIMHEALSAFLATNDNGLLDTAMESMWLSLPLTYAKKEFLLRASNK